MKKDVWREVQGRLTDTHCHLQAYGDEAEVWKRNVGGMRIHQVTSSPAEYEAVRVVAQGREGVHACVGLIPQDVRVLAGEVGRLCEAVHETRFVGEVGLDYVTLDEHDRQLQRSVFEDVLLACAGRGDCVLSVHSRRAQDDVFAMVGGGFPGQVILHWFSGHVDHVRQADAAFWFSVNTAMARSKRSRFLMAEMSRERVLLETDGPYVREGERPAEPRDLCVVIQCLSRLWGVDSMEVVDQLARNYDRLMGV